MSSPKQTDTSPHFNSTPISIPDSLISSPVRSIDYSDRSQWLRASVLGANDGLISVASLMIGIGAVNNSPRAMIISGLAGLIAGAFSMAIGEFVSVYTQYDMESAHMKKDFSYDKEKLPSPLKAGVASALAFATGAAIPLLAGGFIESWSARVVSVGLASSIGLVTLGAAGAAMGGTSVKKASLRVLLGGWVAMLLTYGILRLFRFGFKVSISSVA